MLEEKIEPHSLATLDLKTCHKATAIRTAQDLHQDEPIDL